MPRDPSISALQKAFHSTIKEDKALAALMEQRRQSRRSFLRNSLLTAGSLALTPTMLKAFRPGDIPGNNPQVIIVGAGIAGLNACYQLKKAGISSIVYEASSRIGGRMFTMKDQFGQGLTTDIGGEFVDSSHADILALTQELNLPLYHLEEDPLVQKTYFFGDRHINQLELRQALAPFVPRLATDIHGLPPVISHLYADSFRNLDEQSITQYLQSIGISGWLFDYLNVTLTREYGMEASVQSAINFLIMFEPPLDSEKEYELFGPGHEIYKIKGGSQQLTDALYARVKEQVVTEHVLTAVEKQASGLYQLTLKNGSATTRVQAPYILMAIPFTILRAISFSPTLPAEKQRCINEIGYGNSCKFILGFENKPWRKAGHAGYTFTDISFGCGWDSSQLQSEQKGSFTVFGGGGFGEKMNRSDKDSLLSGYLAGLEKIYPGSRTAFSGKKIKFCWSQNPFSRAGYSSFKKGQWSTLAGWEGVPVENIYFAGEHVSRDFQGYMNGGAQTAREAVALITEKIHQQTL